MPLQERRRLADLRAAWDGSVPERLELLRNHRERLDRQIVQLEEHARKMDEKIRLCSSMI